MKILYIGGAGRSGSTILEMILGNLPGFFSVGEIRHYWEYTIKGGVRCGCGEALNKCDYWSQVHSLLTNDAGIDFSETARLAIEIDRTRNLPFLTYRYPPTNREFFRYMQATYTLYRHCYNVSGAEVLVDSSKAPSHLYLLKQFPETEIYTLHLVRDPRAVAYAWNKRRKIETASLSGEKYMDKRPIIASLYRWAFENYFLEKYAIGTNGYCLMRYEDFVSNPMTELINKFSEMRLDLIAPENFLTQTSTLNATHSVGGNPIRFSPGVSKISADTTWTNNSVRIARLLSGVIMFPFLRHYSYPLDPEQPS